MISAPRVSLFFAGRWFAGITTGIFVFCSRAWLINSWGSPAPFWDQWDAEALALYLPWLNGELRWSDFFAAHNEHRMALTRAIDLALFALNGGWSIWGQFLVNALLHAAIAAALVGTFWPGLVSRSRGVFVGTIAVAFAAPWGWQNALWGFQSAFYLSNLLSIVALVLIVADEPFRWKWCLGWLVAVLALFTNASGPLASIVGLGMAAIPLRHKLNTPQARAAFAALAVAVGAGFALRVTPAYHEPLHAHTVRQFIEPFMRCLAWPHVERGWLAVILQLPLIALVFMRWRSRTALDRTERCAVALGALAILHATAVAVARGGGLVDQAPLSRYQDALLPGFAAQLFALLRLAATDGQTPRLATVGWLGIAAAGLLALAETNLSLHLPFKRTLDRAGIEAVRTYLVTGDADVLHESQSALALHPSSPRTVQRVLDEPRLRAILPEELRDSPGAPLVRPPWVIVHGKTLTAFSALLLFISFWLCRASVKPRPVAG